MRRKRKRRKVEEEEEKEETYEGGRREGRRRRKRWKKEEEKQKDGEGRGNLEPLSLSSFFPSLLVVFSCFFLSIYFLFNDE